MTDGQLAFVGIMLTILATVGAGMWTARVSERRNSGTDSHQLPTGQTLDSSTVPAQLAGVLHSMSEQLQTVMTDRDRLQREHEAAMVRVGALERREGLLHAHIEDLKEGVLAARYPPFPDVPAN